MIGTITNSMLQASRLDNKDLDIPKNLVNFVEGDTFFSYYMYESSHVIF